MAYKPENYQDVIANMTFKDSEKAAEFYAQALNAKDIQIMKSEDGSWVMHGNMKIGDSVIFFNDENDMMPRKAPSGPVPIAFYIYVEDVDAAYQQAVKNGMQSIFEPQDMFWGDRTAVVVDPFHYTWTFSTQTRQVSDADLEEGRKSFGN